MLSTMITAPSTRIPKSIAPRLIRFAQTPNRFIMINEKSKASGMVEATNKPPRKLPKKTTRTKITISAPSERFSATVDVVLFISLLRSRKGSIFTPSGKDFWIKAIRSFTSLITSFEFSPFNIITIPPTASPLPFLVNAPYRKKLPYFTSATSLIKTGCPFTLATGVLRISSSERIKPSPRIKFA